MLDNTVKAMKAKQERTNVQESAFIKGAIFGFVFAVVIFMALG